MTKRVVCFDLDDTLWEFRPAMERADAKLLSWMKEKFPEGCRYFEDGELFNEVVTAVYEKETTMKEKCQHNELRKAVIESGLQRGGVADDEIQRNIDAAVAKWVYLRSDCVELFPHCELALAKLKERYALSAVSNGNACLTITKLDNYFSDHFTPLMPGMLPKPHPAMFESVLKKHGVAPEDVVMVGDDPEKDIAPALEMGMKAVWVNVLDKAHIDFGTPDVQTITCLSHLPQVIDRLFNS